MTLHAAHASTPPTPPRPPEAPVVTRPSPAIPPTAAASDDRLTLVASTPLPLWTGVAVAGTRSFVVFPRLGSAANPSLAELQGDGRLVPYPGGGWNDWRPGANPTRAFVSVSAIHLDHGALWVVDSGVVGLIGHPAVAGAPKVVVIDPATDQVTRIYPLSGDALRPRSALADIRLHGSHAYLTDRGAPALIVLDVVTGTARRVLDGDPATTGRRPAIVDGRILRAADGKPAVINADELEVAPDGRHLYFQPLPGPLYRVETRALDDPSVKPRDLSAGVEFWYNTPSLGGTAIDNAGNLYLTDLGSDAVLRLTPDRQLSLVIRDARLHWAAGLCLRGTDLLLPVAQLDRAALFNHGHSMVRPPFALYRVGLPAPAAR